MSKSFLEYVENRMVENFDYNEAANQINTVIAEQGHITPEQLQEVVSPMWLKKAARGVSGVLGAGKAIGKKLASDAIGKVGSSFTNVGKDIYGAAVNVGKAGADYVGQKLDKMAQYGADVSKTGEEGYIRGHGLEAMRQKKDVLGHEMKGAKQLQAMGGLGSQEAGQRVGQLQTAMGEINNILTNLTPEQQVAAIKQIMAMKGAA